MTNTNSKIRIEVLRPEHEYQDMENGPEDTIINVGDTVNYVLHEDAVSYLIAQGRSKEDLGEKGKSIPAVVVKKHDAGLLDLRAVGYPDAERPLNMVNIPYHLTLRQDGVPLPKEDGPGLDDQVILWVAAGTWYDKVVDLEPHDHTMWELMA